jgi:DNA invertase Pin-like site-specific DNA recombinase
LQQASDSKTSSGWLLICRRRGPALSGTPERTANDRYTGDPRGSSITALLTLNSGVIRSQFSPRFNVPQSVLDAGLRHARSRAPPKEITMSQLVGYARVSTTDQSLDRQLDELRAHGCERIFAEAASGKRGANRPEWDACLAHLRTGDALVVVELSRLGRNAGDLGRLLDHLGEHEIGLRILNLGVDTSTPAGRLIFTIVGAVAAMERELLIERTQSGLAAARARGRVGGRRRAFTPAQEREAQRLYDSGALTVDQIARAVGSSTTTVYRYITPNGHS